MPSGAPALLLTGATGLVGSELLPQLEAARPERRIIALRRPEADITKSGLGLDSATARDLHDRVTEIVHCAADTRFGLSLEAARAVNTLGAGHVLDFARRCRRLEKFAHLSTAYVAGNTTGSIPEAPLPRPPVYFNTYQQSKHEAEEVVLAAGRELPVAIFRLSSIIGDSRTGQVRKFNYVHQLLKLLPRNVLPVAPADLAAPLDLLSSDWASAALVHLFDHAFAAGRVYHVTAGPERSLTVQRMLDVTIETFACHPAGKRWLPVRVPRLVSLAEYEEFVTQSRNTGDRLLNELLRVLGFFLPHLALFQAFDTRQTRAALAASGLDFPSAESCFRKVVEHCLETDWGRRV